ncbi:MAG: WXG100 family type VII secretion target [Anaerolineaceae bacterium]|nr:WXG100 family type VII secretion target [Anaerolineaceae bacterium]
MSEISGIIRMEYQAIEEMINTCNMAASRLEESVNKIQGVASSCEGGGFVGAAGEAYATVLRSVLIPSIGKGMDKLHEVAGDLQGALNDLKDEDAQSAGRF